MFTIKFIEVGSQKLLLLCVKDISSHLSPGRDRSNMFENINYKY